MVVSVGNMCYFSGESSFLFSSYKSLITYGFMWQRPKFLRPNGKIYQAINADTLRAQNMETWPFFNQVLLLI